MTFAPNKTIQVDSSLLEFDRKNPRLVSFDGLENATDQEIMCALVKEADIDELINSIVANGYMDIEPLIVTQTNCIDSSNYRVLEGNRRLSAIRFLLSPELAKICRLSIPDNISKSVIDSIKQVTVYIVEHEEDSRAFIGFKHINGVHRWDSYAKARFLSKWYIEEYDNDITIEEIASKLGDTNQTVRALIGGMLILKQAEDEELFSIDDRTKSGKFGFSHLYTALGRLEYRRLLGLNKDWNSRPNIEPIQNEYLGELKDILMYMYGSKKENVASVIRSQNPDLKYLGMVMENPMSRQILETTNNLDSAYDEVRPSSDVFQDALIIAHTKIQDVMKKLSKFSPTENQNLLSLAEEMYDNSETLFERMKRKIKKNKINK